MFSKPSVAADPDSDVSTIYRDIATKVVQAIEQGGAPAMPEILVSDD